MKWPSWLYRLVPYLGRRQAEEDLQEELRLHLELERERQRDAGVPEADARRAARRRLGNGTLIRERTRDVWGWRWLDDLGRDVRHAVRGLERSPGFAVAVVLVLALGIGANTAMFGIVHGVLLRPLPYPDAGAVVRIGESSGVIRGASPCGPRPPRAAPAWIRPLPRTAPISMPSAFARRDTAWKCRKSSYVPSTRKTFTPSFRHAGGVQKSTFSMTRAVRGIDG